MHQIGFSDKIFKIFALNKIISVLPIRLLIFSWWLLRNENILWRQRKLSKLKQLICLCFNAQTFHRTITIIEWNLFKRDKLLHNEVRFDSFQVHFPLERWTYSFLWLKCFYSIDTIKLKSSFYCITSIILIVSKFFLKRLVYILQY